MDVELEDYCPYAGEGVNACVNKCYWCGTGNPKDGGIPCRIYMMLRDDLVYG